MRCWFEEDRALGCNTGDPDEAARLNRLLVDAGLRVYSIENRSHSLEDLFMQLTLQEDA